ncbi:MAG: hypothetical protein GQ527_08030 [Bacteroidales bacterium]|nr:hypothetical protein [Bacteroidales bacterium]
MKTNKLIILLAVFLGLSLMLSSCGGSSDSENEYLGKLPALSDKYQGEMEEFKEKVKQATDMDDAYKYEKKYKLAKEESDQVISEYLTTHKLETPIPFEMEVDSKYEVLDLQVKGASRTRVDLISNVRIKEDLKNKYGGFEKYFFAYIKAVDKDGNMLGKPTVMSSSMSNREPYTAGLEVPISGSIGNLRYFGEFDKIIFITKEEYEKNK